MPPKNMISVPRKIHMPSDEALRCCSMSEKWCCKPGVCSRVSGAGLSLNADLLESGQFVVVVGLPGDLWSLVEIESRRRRGRLPLESGGVPGIVVGQFAVPHRPEEIDHREKIPDRKNRGTGSRKHVQDLK